MDKETADEIVGRALRGEPYVPTGGGDDAPAQPAAPQDAAYADAHGAIMDAAYDFRDAHISGSPNQKRSAHAALESAVTHALRASNGQAPATQQAGATKEHVRLVRVIADKIEDGTLFRSGIYSNKDLARFVRNVADAAAPQPSPTAQAADPDGEAFRTAARLGLTLRFYGGCAQSGMPGTPSAYEVVTGSDRAAAMREAVERAGAVIASGGESQRLGDAAQAAESVPAIQGEMNVQLDTDSNHSAPGQQRDVARAVALGQPMGNGQDQVACHLGAQGGKLLTVAERNIRSFLRSAQFKSESDREAALNCVDVLWEAARAQADSVPAQVLVAALIAAKQAINSMKAEAETAAQGDEQMMLEACETISNEGLQADIAIRAALASAQQPAPSAAVLDYPHARRFGGCPACGRSDCVAMSCTRTTSDDLLHIAARKQGGA